jgi:AcrR family transcriptional regulator
MNMVDVVRAPCQQRSRDSLERILRAAEAIINNKGYEALTIAEVVRRSRTSVGTVYARFPDKDALLHALHKRVITKDLERFKAQLARVDWDSLSLEESVRALARIKQKQAEGSERMYEAFVIKGATDSRLRADAYNVKAQYEELEVDILKRHVDAMGHEDPEAAIRIACRLGQAAREERVQRMKSGVPGPGGVPQDILLAKLGDVVVAYLKNSGRERG